MANTFKNFTSSSVGTNETTTYTTPPDGKIILEASDTITVTSDTAASADVVLSILEQT